MYCNFMTISLLMLVFKICAISGIHGSSQPFTIITHYKEVEEKAVSYAKSVRTVRGKLHSLGSNLKDNICSTSSRTARIEFCKRALRIDYYGFEFDLRVYKYSACEQQNFSTKLLVASQSHPFQLDMFSCPPIKYTDIGTGEEVFLPYIYAASRGKSHDTAFLFVQRQTSNVKYPLLYIKNIYSKAMKSENEMERIYRRDSLVLVSKHFRKAKPTALDTNYGSGPYQKFMRRFASVNVCGLRRKHKIVICNRLLEKEFIRSELLPLDVQGYDAECRKRDINFGDKKGLKFENEQHTLPCPPVKSNLPEEKLVEQGNYYISTCMSPYTTALLHRQNMKGQKLRVLRSLTHYANTGQIIRDIQRDRFIPYPSEDEWTERTRHKSAAQIINEMNSLQSTPYKLQEQIPQAGSDSGFHRTKKSSGSRPSKILEAVWLAEELLISFSKVTTTNQIYKRFVDTYQSTGSCELSERQHQRICDQAAITRIKQQETRGRLEKDEVFSCHRRKVILRAREAEDLETDTFAMRQCEFKEYSYLHSYFVGKSHLRNVAILYRSPSAENPIKLDANIVYVHEVIMDINSQVLPATSTLNHPH